jgi:Domain of unknown function (DUF1848).
MINTIHNKNSSGSLKNGPSQTIYFQVMSPHPVYISASRRTDIPRFFSADFFAAWQRGKISFDSGYGRSYTVSLKPDDVLGYIFWSKDFSPFIKHPLFDKLISLNNAVFHFTINNCPDLEPRVAPLQERIATLFRLCDLVGPERVLWRFDPVCKYRSSSGEFVTNEQAFYALLQQVRKAGVKRCYFSFMSDYNKLAKRGIAFREFNDEEKTRIAEGMLDSAMQANMSLWNCCNNETLKLVPGIHMAHCIEDELLKNTDRFNVHRTLAIKPTRRGCGCCESRDIGSYLQKCPHGCLYCYANPVTSSSETP